MSILLSCLIAIASSILFFPKMNIQGLKWKFWRCVMNTWACSRKNVRTPHSFHSCPVSSPWEMLVWSMAATTTSSQLLWRGVCCSTLLLHWCWRAVGFYYPHCSTAKCVCLCEPAIRTAETTNELEVDFQFWTMAPVSNSYVTGLFSIPETPLLRVNHSALQVFEAQDFNLY